MRWHVENTGSMGIGGVKQTVRSWVWESRRQTTHVLLHIHTLHRGLFQPDPAKVIEAENIIQNPFSWAGSFGFSSCCCFCLFVFNTHIVSLERNVSGRGGRVIVREFFAQMFNTMGVEPHVHIEWCYRVENVPQGMRVYPWAVDGFFNKFADSCHFWGCLPSKTNWDWKGIVGE